MKPFRSNRQVQRADWLDRVATSTAANLIEQSAESGSGPFAIAVGRLPRFMQLESSISQASDATLKRLGGTTLQGSIIPDVEASLAASTRRIETEPGYADVVPMRHITLIFERVPVLH